MNRIQLIFLVVFLAIAIPVGILLSRSFSQIQLGAQYAYQEHAYLVLKMLNDRIHSDLAVEEKRSYSDYRFIRTVPVLGGEEVTISPLAEVVIMGLSGISNCLLMALFKRLFCQMVF